jgi:pimeloyl-ACP methyl ester carboxylesterase
MRLLAPLARTFTVHRISRRAGLASGTNEEFQEPFDVLGISTGGSIALQLAADRAELVSRLLVAGAACRLSEHGRSFQRRAGLSSPLLATGAGQYVLKIVTPAS